VVSTGLPDRSSLSITKLCATSGARIFFAGGTASARSAELLKSGPFPGAWCFPGRHSHKTEQTMEEINPLVNQVKDMKGRLDALRGYL